MIYLYPNLPSPPERETQREWTPSCHSHSGQSNNSALSAFADFPLDTEMSADTSPFVLTARPLPTSSRLAWSLHGHSSPHQPEVLPALLPGDWDQESQCHRISHYPGTGLFNFLSAGASDTLLAGVMGHGSVQPDIGYSEVLAYVVGDDFCPAERPTVGGPEGDHSLLSPPCPARATLWQVGIGVHWPEHCLQEGLLSQWMGHGDWKSKGSQRTHLT